MRSLRADEKGRACRLGIRGGPSPEPCDRVADPPPTSHARILFSASWPTLHYWSVSVACVPAEDPPFLGRAQARGGEARRPGRNVQCRIVSVSCHITAVFIPECARDKSRSEHQRARLRMYMCFSSVGVALGSLGSAGNRDQYDLEPAWPGLTPPFTSSTRSRAPVVPCSSRPACRLCRPRAAILFFFFSGSSPSL